MLKVKPSWSGKDSCQGDSGGPFTVDVEGKPTIETLIIAVIPILPLYRPPVFVHWVFVSIITTEKYSTCDHFSITAPTVLNPRRPASPRWSCILGNWMRKGDG